MVKKQATGPNIVSRLDPEIAFSQLKTAPAELYRVNPHV